MLANTLFSDSYAMLQSVIYWVLLLISAYYVMYANYKYKLVGYFKVLNVLLLMFTIYGVALLLSGEKFISPAFGTVMNNASYTTQIYCSLLPIYAFYTFSVKGFLNEKVIKRWVIVFFIVAISIYIQTLRDAFLRHLGSVEVTNNAGYIILPLIPLMAFLNKKPFMQFVGLTICMLLILFAMKRGAILIGAVCLLYFLFVSLKLASKSMVLWVFLSSIGLILAGYFIVVDMIGTSDYFQSRIEETLEGNTSSRDVLYGDFASHIFYKTGFLQFLFGSGANATLKVSVNYAHNDWLEIAVNQGFVGVAIFFAYWVAFYKSCKRIKSNPSARLAITLIFLIYFMKTLFSMSYSDMNMFATCILGYCLSFDSKLSLVTPINKVI